MRAAYPDFTARDSSSGYYDPRSTERNVWQMGDVAYERELPRFVSLTELRTHPELGYMVLLRKGSRLSVQPVTPDEWEEVLRIARGPAPAGD